ncbi:MAG: TVP38/TMEM64 family protein [Rhodospirillales bacterium]|nr:TVP38/TMEM64 family protein [Rhodospirillales bacterium]MDH3911488.1 TVP38/TMEM64 family protein [Rhodospirillales bacterium]MDH3917582.1 TVP38/TMEM64 family protein [Rhodospirillales bacterium]MDH3965467.1 TVP38/TMEM64 family protein [Rhodospirillales bacterium]
MVGGGATERRRGAVAVRIAGVALLGLGVVAVATALWLGWGRGLTIQTIQETIQSWGAWGVFASMGLMVIHSFVPFPAEFVTFANGMVYGPLWGTVITWSGAMLGAFAAFGVARVLGRPFVEGLVAKRDWHALDDWAAREGWQVLLVSRFIPVIAFNLINYAAGLTRVTWWTFAWTTGLGILPLTVLFVVMGDNIESLGWRAWALLLGGGLVLWLLLRRRLRPAPARKEGSK